MGIIYGNFRSTFKTPAKYISRMVGDIMLPCATPMFHFVSSPNLKVSLKYIIAFRS